jgi:sialate O-acetylesterase
MTKVSNRAGFAGIAAASLLVVGALGGVARGELEIPSVLGDDMVLQRGTDAPIWGWDTAGTTVSVEFRGETRKAAAGKDGRWEVQMPTGDAGGPFELKVAGSTEVALKNVLVGEVWVAGGQSNMWWAVSNCTNAKEEIAASDLPEIRWYDANNAPREAGWRAETPQRSVKTRWEVTSPRNVGGFAGTAFFFARELHRKLGVPVGIVHLAVPGSVIEPWMSKRYSEVHLADAIENWKYRREDYPNALKRHEQAMRDWEEAKAKAEKEGKKAPREPRRPRDPGNAPMAGQMYNAMVYPCAPFAAKGFLWWQGESNAWRSEQYRVLFPAMIDQWRQLWRNDDMPFVFVELANFMARQTQPVQDDAWPALRDAQTEALRLNDVYRICVIDILPAATPNNIHPPNKQLAGHRLFLTAMANVYGKMDLEWSGPVLRQAKFDGKWAMVWFDHAEGLKAKDGKLKGFALAGADRKFHWADAEIRDGSVVLSCKDVPKPVAVRYNWANNPIGNLYNAKGLPAFPFRTDTWVLRVRN